MWLSCLKGLGRWLWYSLAASIITFALLISAVRVAFPILNHHKNLFEKTLARTLKHPVTLGQVQLSWRGFNPALRFSDITIFDKRHKIKLLNIHQLNFDLALFSSVWHRELLPKALEIAGANVSLYELKNNIWQVSDESTHHIGNLKDILLWMLTQSHVSLRDINLKIHYLNKAVLQINHFQAKVTPAITPMIAGNFELNAGAGRVNFVWKWLDNNSTSMFYLQAEKINSGAWLAPTLAMLNVKNVPPISGIFSGQFWLNAKGRQVQKFRADMVDSNVTIEASHYFKKPLTLKNISTELFWQQEQGYADLHVSSLHFLNQDSSNSANFSVRFYSFPKQYIETMGHFSLANVAAFKEWVPVTLSASLQQWLRQAFLKGDIDNAQFAWQGMNHHFSLHLPLHQVDFRFSPKWPMIKNIEGALDFDNQGLYIQVEKGDIGGNHLTKTLTVIPNLTQPKLYVQGQVDGSLDNGLRFLEKSPLPLAPFVKGWKAKGNMHLQLSLGIDLKNKNNPVESKGDVQFQQDALFLPGTALHWQGISGHLFFHDENISASALQGNYYGSPTTVAVSTVQKKNKPVYYLHFSGLTQLADKYFSGKTPYHALLKLSLNKGNPQIAFRAHSDLVGLKSLLPAPLAKKATEKIPISLYFSFVPHQVNALRLSIQHHLTLAIKYIQQEKLFKLISGTFSIGNHKVTLPKDNGARIDVHLPEINLDRWLGVVQELKRRVNSASNQRFEIPWKKVTLNLSKIIFHRHAILNTKATLSKEKKDWKIRVNNDLFRGTLRIPGDKSVSWLGRFDYCMIPAWWHASGKANAMSLPSIDFSCQHFFYHKRYLGQFNLITHHQSKGLDIKLLQFYTKNFGMAAKGSWRSLPQDALYLTGKIKANDLGELLQQLGVDQAVKEGYGEANFNLHWTASPFKASAANATGNVHFDFHAGRILKLSKEAETNLGVGRFLNLLSLQSLPLTVFSGFQTLSEKGFQFELLKGEVNLHQGKGELKDLSLVGPIAWVRANGAIDFKRQHYDLHLTVIPNITSSLPLIVALAGGPLAGAIAWVADQILGSQIGKAAEKFFHIKGSWKHPNVVKLPTPRITHSG